MWCATLTVTGITVYLAFVHPSFLTDPFRELFIIIEGSVIASLIFESWHNRLNQPSILIEPHCKMNKIGFSVQVKDKNVKDATVICNNQPIKWEELNGVEVDAKSLFVGHIPPAFFYPFTLNLGEWGASDDEKQYIPLSVGQKAMVWGANFTEETRRVVYDGTLTLPKGKFSLTTGTTNADSKLISE